MTVATFSDMLKKAKMTAWNFLRENIFENGLPKDVETWEDLGKIDGLNGEDLEQLVNAVLMDVESFQNTLQELFRKHPRTDLIGWKPNPECRKDFDDWFEELERVLGLGKPKPEAKTK